MAPKGQRTDTLIEILRHGLDIVLKQGFQAAGLNDILRAAGVPKGSFYYYFRSKEEFGLHLIDFYAGFLFARFEDTMDDESMTPLGRLREFFREFRRDMSAGGFSGGSLIGNLAQEMAGQNSAFRERLEKIYESFGLQILSCLKAAVSRDEIPARLANREVADFIINSWEGAVLRAKAEGSVRPFDLFERHVFEGMLVFTDRGEAVQ